MNKPIYHGMSILDISKTLMHESWTEQNYVTWILTALLFILKLKIFIKMLLITFKNGLIHQATAKMIIGHF